MDALKTLMVGPGVDYSKIVQISDEHSKDYEYLILRTTLLEKRN